MLTNQGSNLQFCSHVLAQLLPCKSEPKARFYKGVAPGLDRQGQVPLVGKQVSYMPYWGTMGSTIMGVTLSTVTPRLVMDVVWLSGEFVDMGKLSHGSPAS